MFSLNSNFGFCYKFKNLYNKINNVAGTSSGQKPLPDTLAIHIAIFIIFLSTKLNFYF